MSVSESVSTGAEARATRIRWAAVAAMLAGLLTGAAQFLRPMLDVQLDTPESTVLAVASALGRLLFVVALVGVHLVYGPAYGLFGRVVVRAAGSRIGPLSPPRVP